MPDFYEINAKPALTKFLEERTALQSVAIRRSTGNDVSGPLFSPLFSLSFLYSFGMSGWRCSRSPLGG